MIKICVAGVSGRMGGAVLKEAQGMGFQIVGAIAAPGEPIIGKTLSETGICNSGVAVSSPGDLQKAARDADVYISFTNPSAELSNIPIVANMGKRIVMGTTGFSEEQMGALNGAISDKIPAVFSSNFSVGVNILYRLIQSCGAFPPEYDFSISEIHHTGKKDAPSGTAKKMGEIVSKVRGYSNTVHGREGLNPRASGELEIVSMRAGGVPGIHDLVIAGPSEMLKIEHVAFSRSVFARGALYAAEWLQGQSRPGIYGMDDVLK
ncbi:MAG: 4-hydroxy-tetrahydrodipicolinate reductase [Candidatus Thermoplasmatota archaeon]|nr:4-hydroxy-tetrahydrodipicolinate reductase [Candidatus Thermoplasmatota archaeon]